MSKTPYPSTAFALILVACLACGSAVAQQFTAWSAPVNLGPSINTEFSEFHSAISADGLTLFFASDRPGGFGSDGTNDLWVAQRRNRNADWEPAQNLGPKFNTPFSESGPELSPDGHWLFFASGGLGPPGQSLDIYVAFRQDTSDNLGWEQPSNLGKGVNSNVSEGDPTIFVDPNTGVVTLYFARSNKFTDFDIYTSTQGADGTFGPAVLVPELSSPYRDTHPTIRRDGLEIYLSSNRSGSLGGIDLWVSTRPTTNDKWSMPVNLGKTINTASEDRAPYLSDDGLTLLFTSDRPGGFGDNDFYMVTRKISH
jgi:Tol biopolymer transport system component